MFQRIFKGFFYHYQESDRFYWFLNEWRILIMLVFHRHWFLTVCTSWALLCNGVRCVQNVSQIIHEEAMVHLCRVKVNKVSDYCRKSNWTKRDLCTSRPRKRPHIWSKSWMLLSKCICVYYTYTLKWHCCHVLFHYSKWHGFIPWKTIREKNSNSICETKIKLWFTENLWSKPKRVMKIMKQR